MDSHLDTQLEALKERLLVMAYHAETAVVRSLQALLQRDDSLASQVKQADRIIDQFEIEIDDLGIQQLTKAPLAEDLREKVSSHPREWPQVEIVSGDVLTVDFGKLVSGNFHIYGNLPYYITSPILHHLFEYAGQIISIHIVIQLEVAERIVAKPGRREYGYLSALCQYYANPAIVLRIPPGAFRPPPKVQSALVRMTLPGERVALNVRDDKRFLQFIQGCFEQKRKTLRNNLKRLASDQEIHRALEDSGLRLDSRAEQLTLAQFAALFARLA